MIYRPDIQARIDRAAAIEAARNATPAPDAPPAVSGSPAIDKTFTGPVRWHMLHSRARRPVKDKAAEIAWINTLAGSCGDCVRHWLAYTAANPPTLDTPADYIRWAWAAHNAVRERLNQAPWPFDDGPLDPRPITYRTATGSKFTLHNQQLGKVAVLAGNGPSLASVDPAALAGMDIMAINNAAAVIHPKYWVAGDTAANFPAAIFEDERITKFFPFNRRTETPREGSTITAAASPSMVFTTVDDAFDPATWLAKTVIAWGKDKLRSSMTIGLRILIDLGYRTIYLVGVDWQMHEQRPYASSDGKDATGVRLNNGLYATWGERYAALADELATHGVTIINATPGSKLGAFAAGEI